MPLTQESIQREISKGSNIFCATCVHHHDALDKGLPGCLQSVRKTCAGPLSGKKFPEYEGLIPRERFTDICLICGTPDPYLAIYIDGEHTFSLCYHDRKAIEVLPSLNVTLKPIVVPLPTWRKG